MKNKLINQLNKKKILIPGAMAIVILASGIAINLGQPQRTQAVDSPLVETVAKQGNQLANHEARITNTENDVKDVQNNTNTAPSINKVVVPSASTSQTPTLSQAPTPQPVATPATVTSYEEVYVDDLNTDCKLTYSDGTTYVWRWRVVNPSGVWETDGVGQNGHYVSSTSTSSKCDQSIIGTSK